MFGFLHTAAPLTAAGSCSFMRGNSICRRRVTVASQPRRLRVGMTIPMDDVSTALKITGTNVALTQSMRAYAEEKVGKAVRKYSTMLTAVDVHLSVEHNRAIESGHKCEVSAAAGKQLLRAESRAPSMYAAIDAAERTLARVLRKFKERREKKRKDVVELELEMPAAPPMALGEDDDDGEVETTNSDDSLGVKPVKGIVRRKRFNIPRQTLEEACLCLEYMAHDFYMFRDAHSGEVSLVYRRKNGGFGLIEPMNDD